MLLFGCGLQPAWAQAADDDYNPDQGPTKSAIAPCGSSDNFYKILADDPALADRIRGTEEKLREMANNQERGDPPTYYIPVVFHIIQSNLPNPNNEREITAANAFITPEQVQQQLDVLNKDFAATNADLALMRSSGTGYDHLVGTPRIQFCLATRDAAGNPINGIDRAVTNRRYYFDPLNTDDLANPSNTPNIPTHALNPRRELPAFPDFPTNKYLNIWVCINNYVQISIGVNTGYAGFAALYPTYYADPNNDGLVISSAAFGVRSVTRPTWLARANGRTLTHEVGHWFSLRHIWGDDNDLCATDPLGGTDNVGDTPDQANNNGGYSGLSTQLDGTNCPFDRPGSPLPNSCGNLDIYMNFMDYTCERCKYMFSVGQVTKMRNALTLLRPGLLNSLATAPASVAIVSNLPGSNICPGDVSNHRFHAEINGGCGGSVLSYHWTVSSPSWRIANDAAQYPGIIPDGSTSTTISLTITYRNGSSPTVALSTSTYIVVGPPPAPTFFVDVPNGVSVDICPGTSGFFAANSVPTATAYTWTLPPGFTGTTLAGTFSGPVITSSGPIIQLTAPQGSGSSTVTYPLSVTVTVGGCVSPAATLNFHLTLVQAEITTNPVMPFPNNIHQVCSNTVATATVDLITCTQGSNSGFAWSIDPEYYPPGQHQARIISGATTNACLFTTGNSRTFLTPQTVTLRVSFTNSTSGPQTAIFTFNPGGGLPSEFCVDIIDDLRPTGPPTLYPNPATGQVTVERLVGSVRLYNSQGRQVYQKAATPDAPTALDLHGLPIGLYQVVGQDAAGQPVRLQLQVQP